MKCAKLATSVLQRQANPTQFVWLAHSRFGAGVEACFASLAQGKVDVPMPMHIGIPQSPSAGPGDCHIKGGYIEGMPTFTVKVSTASVASEH